MSGTKVSEGICPRYLAKLFSSAVFRVTVATYVLGCWSSVAGLKVQVY